MHPALVQEPRPPLTVAALGPKALRIAAEYADSWNFFPGYGLPTQQALEQTAQRNRLLDEYCVELGPDGPAATTRCGLPNLSCQPI
jgi:alkanesulfonate monooxygenase SsuD/methylene tetrahydromethanopterin reductase-like flavin-dependent oxidoreductase (luciferase family)